MKNIINKFVALLAIVIIGATSPAAFAVPTVLDLSSAGFLGYVTPGVAADPVSETDYVRSLIGLPVGGTGTVYSIAAQLNGVFRYTTVTDTDLPNPLFLEKYVVGTNDFTSTSEFSITGVDYVLAKYGTFGNLGSVSLVWWVTNIGGDAQIATSKGLSHVSLFGPVREVPDSGSTMLLLIGSTLAGLVCFRKFA